MLADFVVYKNYEFYRIFFIEMTCNVSPTVQHMVIPNGK